MKSSENPFQQKRMAPLALVVLFVLAIGMSCSSQDGRNQVFDAYQLRIGGQADSAAVLLTQITRDHPDLAIAWYERSRATIHMGMQNPQGIKLMLDSAKQCIDRAISLDPDNAMYYSSKGRIEILEFYMTLQAGDSLFDRYLSGFESTFKKVFELDPSYFENKVTLVEFYGILPEERGGDREKAESYTRELEAADLVSGARAREIMMPEDGDYEAFWKDIAQKVPGNADVKQALGRVYLFKGNYAEGEKLFREAIALDPAKNALYLDLGRYQMMQAMQNPAALDSLAPLVKEQFDNYLNSSPEPLNPMKAWTYGMLAMISQRSGNNEAGDEYLQKANDLDPYFPRTFGRPDMELYCPPDIVIHEQQYYMAPF